ncbi:hypothetical protein SAMN04489867_0424 [Pedococcus dokdonensis]|uniref:Uncharacterized protein n=1 Tax=Pedococcus dokdonensis TaxID=443156 RepID=A0A1H0LX10_9MICO|nr:hypothetical protein SAMN04489867_0424 [Pedococcus dokdonensis]
MTTLAARAQQSRVDHERARRLADYSKDVRRGLATPPTRDKAPAPPVPRHAPLAYLLGNCLGCGREMWVPNRKPRVPICELCTDRR